MILVVTLVVILAIFLSIRLQRHHHFLQYLFFLRFPLLTGLALLLLPVVAQRYLQKIMANMFILDWWGLLIVTWLSIYCCWMAMYEAALVFLSVAKPYRLNYQKDTPDGPWENTLPAWFERSWKLRLPVGPNVSIHARLVYPLLLAVPTVFWAFWLARSWRMVFAIIGGIGTAVVLRYLLLKVIQRLRKERLVKPTRRNLKITAVRGFVERMSVVKTVKDSLEESFEEINVTFMHRRSWAFFGLSLIVYVLGYFFLNPATDGWLADHTPALAYLLLILLMLGGLMPTLSLFFDKYRIPVELVLLVVFLGCYNFTKTDHLYEMGEFNCTADSADMALMKPLDAVSAWDKGHPRESFPVMVVVAASGGGIAAAYWTTLVMEQLGTDPDFGQQFLASVVLVSAVSGGSIGAMYVVDAYSDSCPPGPAALHEAVVAARSSSLASAMWGITYPDLMRVIGAFPIIDRIRDRGWAQEQRWASHLNGGMRTLRNWRCGVEAGWRPAMVFNATFTENGKRFLVSPIHVASPDIDAGSLRGSWSFAELYPGADMSVVTAARLSATFPYLTPVARPDIPDSCGRRAYHVADGGYYDNFGVLTTLEFLAEVLPSYRDTFGRRRCLIVQIRGASAEDEEADTQRGWLYELLGPAITIVKVRNSTQIARNDFELGLLTRYWAEKDSATSVEIKTVTFERSASDPLSWHLSASETDSIAAAWAKPDNVVSRNEVKAFLRRQ